MPSVFGVDIYGRIGGANRLEMGNGTGVALILDLRGLGIEWLTAQITASAEEPDEAWITNAVAEIKISNNPRPGTFKSFPSGAVQIDTDYGITEPMYVGCVDFVGVDITTAGSSAGIREVWFGAQKK